MSDPTDANRPEHEQSSAWTDDPYVGKPYGYRRVLPPSPNGNGRDVFAGMPWWVRAIALVGVPALISMGLVFYGSLNIAGNVTANGHAVAMLAQDAQLHDQRVMSRFEQLQRSADTQTRILRSICQSVARTDLQREKCTE